MNIIMKKYAIIFVLSLFLDVISSLLRSFSDTWAVIIDSLCFYVFTFLFLQKCAQTKKDIVYVLVSIILGMILLEFPIRVVHFTETKKTLVSSLIPIVSVIMSTAYFLYRKNATLALSLFLWLGLVFFVRPSWHNFVLYGKLDKGINVSDQKLLIDSTFINFREIRKKYVLLDFWSSKCGVCFRTFPKVQKLYDEFKEKENVMIASVFVAHDDETYSDGTRLLQKDGYTFPVIGCTDWNSSLISTLGINGVPTVIILNEKKEVIFRGSIEFAQKKFEKIAKE